MDIRQIFAALRRRASAASAVFLIVFTMVVLYTLQATPLYISTASLIIDPRENEVVERHLRLPHVASIPKVKASLLKETLEENTAMAIAGITTIAIGSITLIRAN